MPLISLEEGKAGRTDKLRFSVLHNNERCVLCDGFNAGKNSSFVLGDGEK